MTAIRMALSELRRLVATTLGKVAVVALVLVPTLYAGLYLYANHDPYANLSRVPAAVVVEDEGATLPDGTPLDAGARVADHLLSSGSFDWREVSAEEAAAGVEDGTFDFAIVVPAGFSAALSATAGYDPTQAQLQMITNDANSYLATTIADKVSSQVRESIASEVGKEAAATFLTGLASVRGGLVDAADGARKLADGAGTARRGARDLESGAARLSTGATDLSDGLGRISTQIADLPAKAEELAAGARKVADGNAKVASVGREADAAAGDILAAYRSGRGDLADRLDEIGVTKEQKKEVLAVYDQLGEPVRAGVAEVQGASADLDRLAAGATKVADGNEALAAAVPALVDGVARAETGASKLASGASQLESGAGQLREGLGKLRRGADRLADQLEKGVEKIPASDEETRRRLARTIGDPVAVTSTADTTAGSYGAGLAPFFLSLAAWIGGYVLFTQVRPLSRRAIAANQTPLRVALGGWIAPALLGATQMALALGVVSLGVRIVPENVAGTLLFMMFASAVFIAVVQALTAWFGLAGQFFGLVLMVLQLVTAGGTFPWQTIPQPLWVIHHVMPMSYAVDGLRQLMYGGLDQLVWRDVGVLLAWFAVALLATSRAARRQRTWTTRSLVRALAE